MRVADFIFKTLADWGTRHVFLVTGGGAMHLNDALGLEKRIRYVCNLHEQACAIAAEGYARVTGKPGVICVTTGPGGTNALTGVLGAWLDSIPMVVISGQVKRATTISACPELKLRQLGDQEFNIVDAVRPMTKSARMIQSVDDVRMALAEAWRLAQEGRPGPVWLDVPLDIQAAPMTDETPLAEPSVSRLGPTETDVVRVVEILRAAKRPAIIAGQGVRTAGAAAKLLTLAEKCQFPVLTAISGIDLIPSDHPLFFGRPGILGERSANFIMQNCDVFLVLGTRMGIRVSGYAYETVAARACKVMVDVDDAELDKPTFRPDVKIHADVGMFIEALLDRLSLVVARTEWLGYCARMKRSYPVVLPEHRVRTDYVSSYVFPEIVSRNCVGDEIIVTGNGVAYTSTFQAFPVKAGMRMFANQGCASMGYGLPAAVGAAFAGGGRQVICFTGDGSIQMNIQELQTLVNYRLPVKLFVYNNEGYQSIKTTQSLYFERRFVGSEKGSGIILPSLEKLAAAYGLPYARIRDNNEAERLVGEILVADGPSLTEVMCDPFEVLGPKAASKRLPDGRMISRPLHDMAPFLPEDELRANMIGDCE